MSLENQKENETEKTPDAPETEEQVMRATLVTPYYSYILIACIVIVGICQIGLDITSYTGLTNETLRNLVLFGSLRSGLIAGFYKPAFVNGEYWRVLTGAALHGGAIHLLFNCYALFMLGRLIEILSNRAHLAVVFLLSVIGGSLMSFAFYPQGVSIGASGGIIGFLGYLTVYGFYRRKLMSNALLKNMLFNIAFIAFIGAVVFPLSGKTGVGEVRVDNFAHLGGLLMGAIYGVFQIPRDLYEDPREISAAMEITGLAALGIFVFVSFLTILLLFQIVRL